MAVRTSRLTWGVCLVALAACGGNAFSSSPEHEGTDAQALDSSPESSADASSQGETSSGGASSTPEASGFDSAKPPADGGAQTTDARADGGVETGTDARDDEVLDAAHEAACTPQFMCWSACPLPWRSCTSSGQPTCIGTVCCEACP